MPAVVRNVGDLKRAKNVDGQEVYRQDYVIFHGKPTRVLNTDNHFIYRSRRIGSTLLCTCGSAAVTCGFHVYRRFSSYIGSEVLACQSLISYGIHSDGST